MTIRESLRVPALAFGVAVGVLAAPSGCASKSDENLGFELGNGQPQLVAEAGVDACNGDANCVDANAFKPLCVSTSCQAPYGTCPSDTFLCETNFDSDNDNCGACGVSCPRGDGVRNLFNAQWFCQAGACKMVCDAAIGMSDCNADPTDGCETNTQCDANNCGGCGIKCPAGVECRKGSCGCPSGLTACTPGCGNLCNYLPADNNNCGACGNVCPILDPPSYPHMIYGCVDSKCNVLKCDDGYIDCNGKIEDGCEVAFYDDPKNCGACGRACADGQSCAGGKCACAPNEAACPFREDFFCTDLDNDAANCGACGNGCPAIDFLTKPVCKFGHCSTECAPGLADCDGRADNGCETMTSSDPRNCGGCGIQCDLAAGQPCMGGSCVMAPCNPGGPQ
ncbi:Tryptophan synthase alpha chain [Labilithrix luteola]|uniref:Tryptophan synthase alpha chain n=1 Tax=Labilithrix luteola TaxID=1391654 RepID=A0A0K1PJW0_9BACT|nr:hypothetical protein [Labilithrix luteola]AKU93797.1 Tryptophan synthase alpha chain [Labilithrix luteola]